MKNITKILRFILPYWNLASLNVAFNLLSAVFALFSVTMAIPFLGILFKNESLVTVVSPFEFSAESVKLHFYYFISKVILQYGEVRALIYLSLVIIAMTFLKNLFHYLALYFLAPLRTNVVRDVRMKIYQKVIELPLSFFSEKRKGDVISRTTGDVQEIEVSIISSLEMLFRDPVTILLYFFALFYMSVPLTLFVLVLLPVTGLVIGRIGRSLKQTSLKGQKKMGTILSIIEETLGGLRIIKAFNAEEKVRKRFESINNFYASIMNRIIRRRNLASPLSEFLGTAVMVIIMIYGASLVLSEQSDLSSQQFIGYLMLFYLIIAPSKSFSTAWYNIQKGLASAERINEILDAENHIVEKENAIPVHEFKESIEYRNVSFRYDQAPVLKGINLKIEKGKTVALVGQSGSGKSTIADLLPRFYDVEEGDILIDGVSIKDLKIKDLRSLMGIVNQESILFNDSYFNNIAFGVDHATEEEVISAAKVANANEFIQVTKHGYYTNIGDRGGKMSGGQRQRVSIARAVLKNPPIMILDEATSSLDTESERLVQEALANLMRNRTSLVIAHRLSTVQFADEICVVYEGQIVERGKHEELLAKGGMYKKLHDMQIIS